MPRYIDAKDIENAIISVTQLLDENDFEKYLRKRLRMLPDEMPTADVRKNVHAKWVIEREQLINGEFAVGQFCSNCGYPQYLTTRFCPNCGAVMDETTEEPTMEEYMYGQEGSEEDGSL